MLSSGSISGTRTSKWKTLPFGGTSAGLYCMPAGSTQGIASTLANPTFGTNPISVVNGGQFSQLLPSSPLFGQLASKTVPGTLSGQLPASSSSNSSSTLVTKTPIRDLMIVNSASSRPSTPVFGESVAIGIRTTSNLPISLSGAPPSTTRAVTPLFGWQSASIISAASLSAAPKVPSTEASFSGSSTSKRSLFGSPSSIATSLVGGTSTTADILAEAIGSSFEESSDSECSCEDFAIADENEENRQILKALKSKAATNAAVSKASEITSVYDFVEEDNASIKTFKRVKLSKKSEVELLGCSVKECCDNLCNLKRWSNEVKTRLQTVVNHKSKSDIKQNLLDHLHKQSQMGLSTRGFLFGGNYFCRKGFTEVAGVSRYIVKEVFIAFLRGQVKFIHGNEIGFRETEATRNFTIWMKIFAHNYGNYAPDEEVIVLSSCFTIKDIYDIYFSEAAPPHIQKSYFYALFRIKFGPNRLDRSLPRIRISKYSKHSKCDQCLLLDQYQRSSKGEADLSFAKSLKQSHRRDFVRARATIEEHRQKALTDPENEIFIQIDDMDNSKVIYLDLQISDNSLNGFYFSLLCRGPQRWGRTLVEFSGFHLK